MHLGHHSLLGLYTTAGAHGLEHFAHLDVLAEEVVDLPDGGAGAAGDALAAAAVDEFVVASASRRALVVRAAWAWRACENLRVRVVTNIVKLMMDKPDEVSAEVVPMPEGWSSATRSLPAISASSSVRKGVTPGRCGLS